MHIHRSEHLSNFTILPNFLLQYRKLSYTARGLLADLLSRPDGWSEDCRLMADTSPQGRSAVRKAVNELIKAGYYRVETARLASGRIVSTIHVYDTPQQVRPGTNLPGPGPWEGSGADRPSVKNQEKVPTTPAPSAPVVPVAPVPPTDPQTREAVAALFQALRPEPRLQLGEAEALTLAPLVARWLERGRTAADLARVLLSDLPRYVVAPAKFIGYRLAYGLPPTEAPAGPRPSVRYAECAECHDPVARPGLCRACAGLGAHRPAVGGGAAATAAGAARVRAAMRGARAALGGPGSVPAPVGTLVAFA